MSTLDKHDAKNQEVNFSALIPATIDQETVYPKGSFLIN